MILCGLPISRESLLAQLVATTNADNKTAMDRAFGGAA